MRRTSRFAAHTGRQIAQANGVAATQHHGVLALRSGSRTTREPELLGWQWTEYLTQRVHVTHAALDEGGQLPLGAVGRAQSHPPKVARGERAPLRKRTAA